MKLKSRKTHSFIEIEVDEIKTNVFKTSQEEIENMIYNLLEVASDLSSYTENSLSDYFIKFDF